MEPKLRGDMEKIIDDCITSEHIQHFINGVTELESIIQSPQDAVFGWMCGVIETGMIAITFSNYGRDPTNEELAEMEVILFRRASEIMNVIKTEMMK